MNENTRIKVFEPLDTNSLSLLSSSSSTNLNGTKSNANSFMMQSFKTPTTPTLPNNDENCNGLLQWKLEKKEFIFKSNSTPSKKRHSPGGSHDPHMLHVRKRKSQLIGAKPRIQSKLYQTTSKLDLLEDDKITTLPIAPPRSSASDGDIIDTNMSINNSVTLTHKKVRLNPIEELRVHNNNDNRYVSYGIPKAVEEEHPIVMVEDYIPYTEMNNCIAKKRISISDLRSKINKRTDDHIPLKRKKNGLLPLKENPIMTLIPHIEEDNVTNYDDSGIHNMVHDIFHIKNTRDDCGDKYISNLGIKMPLKRCVVCEKLLYELSSITVGNNSFKEIVCENCTYEYEKAAKLFENYEFESSIENSSFMSDLENSIEIPETIALPMIREQQRSNKRDQFSKELIERLKMQSGEELDAKRAKNESMVGSNNLTWFLEAREKIKNQWKISGLVPFFLRKSTDKY